MGLYFGFTCGDIDGAINSSRDAIRSHIKGIIEQVCPMLSESTLNELTEENTNYLIDEIASEFETLRGLNSDMREQADRQIDNLEDELSEMTGERDTLQEELDETD